jgi:hypothetical protein
MLANQFHAATGGAAFRHVPYWRQQATASCTVQRVYETDRAPLCIGNHVEEWNGGIGMDAVQAALQHISCLNADDVRMVSFRPYVVWLDARDPNSWRNCAPWTSARYPGEGWKAVTRAA